MSSIPSTADEVQEQEDNAFGWMLAAVLSTFFTLVFVSLAVLVLFTGQAAGDSAKELAGLGILILPAGSLPLALVSISHFVRAMSD
jgi:uncharacterized membrane protein YqjE